METTKRKTYARGFWNEFRERRQIMETIRPNNYQDMKVKILKERLQKLEQSSQLLHRASDKKDVGEALYDRFQRSLQVMNEISSIFPKDKKSSLREEQRRVNDSYVRGVGEKQGLTFTGDTEGLYPWDELPKCIARFCANVEDAVREEIDSIQEKLTVYLISSEDQNLRIEILKERLQKLEQSSQLLHSASDKKDIGEILYEQFQRSLRVMNEISSIFPEDKKSSLREEQRRVNDSYVRGVGEKQGLIFTGDTEGLYSWEDLPKYIARFCSSVKDATREEIDSIQEKLSMELSD
jgi:hypothetical protein